MTLVKVASVSDIKPGEAKPVEVNGEPVALYNADGKFYATSNTCLHRGGPLREGFLEGRTITCPWHGWKYDVTTGANINMPAAHVQTFKVVVQGNDVMIEV